MSQSYLNNNRAQLYSTFSGLPDTISKWESKGLSNEKNFPPFTASKILSQKLVWYNLKMKLKFEWSCLKQKDKAVFTQKNMVNFCILYKLDAWPRDLDNETDFTLGSCLFGGVKLIENTDPEKYL